MSYDVISQWDREAPSYCRDILEKFGFNPYGEPIYRVVWSETQFETVGGIWEERANPLSGNSIVRRGNMLMESNPVLCKRAAYKQVSKYPDWKGKNGRWILEKWLPCSFTPALWHWKFFNSESGLYTSGPYPEHGEYWCSKVIMDGVNYMEPNADVIEYYARQIQAGDEYSEHQKNAAFEERENRKRREWSNRVDDIFDDSMPVGGVEAIFSGPGRKTNRKSVDDVKIAPVPKGLPTTSGSRQL